jgi:hypothetical protein
MHWAAPESGLARRLAKIARACLAHSRNGLPAVNSPVFAGSHPNAFESGKDGRSDSLLVSVPGGKAAATSPGDGIRQRSSSIRVAQNQSAAVATQPRVKTSLERRRFRTIRFIEALKNLTHRNGPSELATLPMPARTYRDSFVDSTCFRKASTRPNVFISSRSARRQPGEKMP